MFFGKSRKSSRSARPQLPSSRRQKRGLFLEPLEERRLLSLLGITTAFPVVAYDSTGVIIYNSASGDFNLTATPLTYKQSASMPARPIIDAGGGPATNEFQLHILVDNTGQLIQSSLDTFTLN